jgi:hypothetical protein
MKRIALVDNATLTAAQRLLGDIAVKNLYNIDGDIEAFENLVQAVLFFDEICCIDDYKSEFRSSRAHRFDFVTFLPQDKIDYGAQLKLAEESTKDVLLRVRGYEIDQDEFREFFDMLKAHLVFNWRMSSSVFYLTVNLLTDDSGVSAQKYSSMHAMIASQLWGEERGSYVAPSLMLKDKSGKRLPDRFTRDKDYEIGDQVQRFAAALNWLALKTNFYARVAEANNMDLVLHPIRHAFLANVIHKSYKISSSTYDSITTMLRNGITGTVREITKHSEPILSELRLPMWSAYLATRTKKPSEFLATCQQLRQEGLFVEARAQLGELQELGESDPEDNYVKSVNKLNLALEKTSAHLLSKYGVSSQQQIAVAPAINLILKAKTGGSIPDIGGVPRPRALSGILDRRGFRGLVRSIVSDLVSIERLGKLHEIITLDVRKESKEKYPIHEESSDWLGRNSSIRKWL